MKKLYFATVCFSPLAYMALLILVFLHHLPFPTEDFFFLMAYFAVGFLLLHVALWRSQRATETKVIWTALNLAFGLLTLPLYWFVVVRRPNAA